MNKERELQLYRDVANHNGEEYQVIVCIEELTELAQVITKRLRGKIDNMHLAEEIADVRIACDCIEEILQLHGAVSLYKQHKLARLEYKHLNGLPT